MLFLIKAIRVVIIVCIHIPNLSTERTLDKCSLREVHYCDKYNATDCDNKKFCMLFIVQRR